MNKVKKALLMTLCAACLVVTTVFGTLAYLTDTDQNVNTFTVGKVDIELDEYDFDKDENESDITPEIQDIENQRDKANKYHLIPGQEYTKDPTVTLEKGSEPSYIYMIVTVKNLNQLKAALPKKIYPAYYSDDVFLLQKLCDWKEDSVWKYAGYMNVAGTNDGEYRFVYDDDKDAETSSTPNALEEANKLAPLFEKIIIPGEDINSENIKYLSTEVIPEEGIVKGGVQIEVKAYAVQGAGFDDYNEAWKGASFVGYESEDAYDK